MNPAIRALRIAGSRSQEPHLTKIHLSLAAAALFALSGGIGCNSSSTGGMTGTDNSFKVVAPTLPVTLKQGDKHTVNLTVDRGSGFQQTVKLDADAPKGLHVDFDKSTVKAGDPKEVAMSITADKDAAIGEHTIKVTAKPETGTATTVNVKVTVSAVK
jgi:hypothetical protein